MFALHACVSGQMCRGINASKSYYQPRSDGNWCVHTTDSLLIGSGKCTLATEFLQGINLQWPNNTSSIGCLLFPVALPTPSEHFLPCFYFTEFLVSGSTLGASKLINSSGVGPGYVHFNKLPCHLDTSVSRITPRTRLCQGS